MPLVSITRLRVRSWRLLPVFFVYAIRPSRQAARAEGNLGIKLLRDRRKTFWTATVWESEATMKRFMIGGVHGRAMRKLMDWCDEAAVVHWTQEGAELPGCVEAWGRLLGEGRPSKVNFPSGAHLAHKFPEPHVGATAETTFSRHIKLWTADSVRAIGAQHAAPLQRWKEHRLKSVPLGIQPK